MVSTFQIQSSRVNRFRNGWQHSYRIGAIKHEPAWGGLKKCGSAGGFPHGKYIVRRILAKMKQRNLAVHSIFVVSQNESQNEFQNFNHNVRSSYDPDLSSIIERYSYEQHDVILVGG